MFETIFNTSRRVKAQDFDERWMRDRLSEMGNSHPVKMHRKYWELATVAQVYHERVGPGGGNCLGFGVGRECIPAWLASRGADVVATDLDKAKSLKNWIDTNQHCLEVASLSHPMICSDQRLAERVTFLPVDMNNIDYGLLRGRFDFTWSTSSMEHLGSIQNGIDFFLTQMLCLKPGGWAVHVTEFNIHNDDETLEDTNLVIFRKKDLIELSDQLSLRGHDMLALDFSGGSLPEDMYIDPPPHKGDIHLNLSLAGHSFTSIALIAQKRGE